MANLFPKHTGLPFTIWLSVKGNARHDVRVKVSPSTRANANEMVSVAIRPTIRVVKGELDASDLAILSQWVEANREAILRYWETEIDTLDLMAELKRVN